MINYTKFFLLTILVTVCGVTIAETPIEDNEYVIFYHHDVLGSPIAVSDGKGRVLWYENTGPYGEGLGRNSSDGITSVGNPIVESADNRMGYTGHEKDNTSGLTYMKARHYDPIIGRFYSNDPIGFDAKSTRSFNRFTYANNSPYVYDDPDGQAPNQAGATDYTVVQSEISLSGSLSSLAGNVGNNNRYFQTSTYGWVDVRHFGTAAGLTDGLLPGGVVKVLGVAVEVQQTLNGQPSGFSPEDLPSNSAGVAFSRFAKKYMKKKSGASLSDAFAAWAESEGSVDSSDYEYENRFNALPTTEQPPGSGSTSAGDTERSEKQNSSASTATNNGADEK